MIRRFLRWISASTIPPNSRGSQPTIPANPNPPPKIRRTTADVDVDGG